MSRTIDIGEYSRKPCQVGSKVRVNKSYRADLNRFGTTGVVKEIRDNRTNFIKVQMTEGRVKTSLLFFPEELELVE